MTGPLAAATARPGLVALLGPAGAGKTSLRPHAPHAVWVSLDDERAATGCCSADQRATPQAVRRARRTAHRGLQQGRCVVWDATNARRGDRIKLRDLAAEHDVAAHAVVLLPPLQVVLQRNAQRCAVACAGCGYTRQVPEPVVRDMHARLQRDLDTLHEEGWDSVTLLEHSSTLDRQQ